MSDTFEGRNAEQYAQGCIDLYYAEESGSAGITRVTTYLANLVRAAAEREEYKLKREAWEENSDLWQEKAEAQEKLLTEADAVLIEARERVVAVRALTRSGSCGDDVNTALLARLDALRARIAGEMR